MGATTEFPQVALSMSATSASPPSTSAPSSCEPSQPSRGKLRRHVRSKRFRSLRVRSRMSFIAVAFIGLFAASMWSNNPREIYEAEQAMAISSGNGLSPVKSSSWGQMLADFSLFDVLDGPGCAAESNMKRYGLFIWILLGVYFFVAIALVCDEYFEESLTCISERLKLSEDVAGATFMAAGSSAPELFVAVIGVIFYPDDNPGPGTIIGSAAFNMCIIVALSCILAPKPLNLTKWAIYRDCTWYLMSLGFLTLVYSVVSPTRADWWEAVVLLLLYVAYCVSMSYNQRIKVAFGFDTAGKELVDDGDSLKGDISRVASVSRLDMNDPNAIAMTPMSSKQASDVALIGDAKSTNADTVAVAVSGTDSGNNASSPKKADDESDSDEEKSKDDEEEEETIGGKIWEIITYPWSFMFKYTIPNCEEDSRFREWFWVTFAMSIVWLGILSFLMVDTFTKISCCLGIPAHFTGLTLIALGTSVPDATASVVVAKDGFGDMAVSNAVGSNLMNILCGLPFSWILGSIASSGDPTKLSDSGSIWVFVLALVVVVFVYLVCIIYNNFVIAKRTGWTLVATYVAFITFVILYETLVNGVGTSGGC